MLVAAGIGSAHPSAYGVPQTSACPHEHGATFNAITPGVAHSGLTAAQQAETRSGTLPGSGAPVFFFLVVGRNAKDAAAVLKVLLVYAATNPNRRDGIGIFVVFGRTGHEAIIMRSALNHALGLAPTATRGLKKNAAWVAFRLKPTTEAGRKARLQVLATCLN